MSIENTVNSQFSALCVEIIEPKLREIALSFCISTSEFYDTVHELSFPSTQLNSENAIALGVEISDEDRIGYDRYAESIKSQQRMYRILKRLLVGQDVPDHNSAQLLSLPKIYVTVLFESMVSTYGSIASRIGDRMFSKLDKSLVIRSIKGIEERDKFSFQEFALLSCLYMTISKSSVNVLNETADTPNKKKRLKGRMRKIKACLFSPEFRDSLFRTLTDLLAKFKENEYAELIDKHYRDYWLPTQKRELRNLNYAFEQGYVLKFPNATYPYTNHFEEIKSDTDHKKAFVPIIPITITKKGTSFPGESLTLETVGKLMHTFNIEYTKVQLFQDFYYSILPLAEYISIGVLPKNLNHCNYNEDPACINLTRYLLDSNKIDRITKENLKRKPADLISWEMYYLALKVCEILDTYIDTTIASTIQFLECLPEADIAGENTLLEYFNTI